jgi:hypothetical protein
MKNISRKITDHLGLLNMKIAKMEADFKEMELKIQSTYERAMAELNEKKTKEMKDIKTLAIMLSQKLKELNWMEYFIKF